MTLHVMPVGGVIPHSAEPDCICDPHLDISEQQIWVHHSLDGREIDERRLPPASWSEIYGE